MDNDYVNEVLPRWRFWKECLVEHLEQYRESLKKYPEFSSPEVSENCGEIIKKIEKAETAESLKQASEELNGFMSSLWREYYDCEYEGVYEADVTNNDRLASWLGMDSLIYKIRWEIKQKTKE